MARNNDTYAPSTARWSQLTPRMPVEWMAMDSEPSGWVTTTGRRGNAVGRQNRHLRLVDDRDREVGAEGAVVGDGEGSTRDVVRVELTAPRPLGQIADAPGHPTQRDLLGPVDDRHNQAFV